MADAPDAPKLSPSLRRRVDAFYTKLKRRQTTSAFGNAREATELLRDIVGSHSWRVTSELLSLVRSTGCRLIAADPLQFNIGNVVRRVLFIIREEFAAACKFVRANAAFWSPRVLLFEVGAHEKCGRGRRGRGRWRTM